MNKEQKQEVIEALKNKFSQYSNFYITDTQNLSVAQITNLRRHCFDKQVEMKVAKNTLIKKALESLDNDRYSGVYDSLHQVTALMFSDSPKEPALIISSFRKSLNGEKPLLKAAFLNGDIFVGDNQLIALTKIKTKNELIGEVIGLLMSPIQRVIGALQNRFETPEGTDKTEGTVKAEVAEPKATVPEVKTETPPVVEAKAKPATTAPEAANSPAKAEVAEAVTEAKAKAPQAAQTKTEITEPVAETTKPAAKPEVAEPKAIVTETKSEAPRAAQTKTEITEPVAEPAKAEVAEPKAVITETKSEAPQAAKTKAEVTEPVAETAKPAAKTEVAEPKAIVTEPKSEVPQAAQTKTQVTEPVVETAKPAAKAEVAEPKAIVTEVKSEPPPVAETKAEETKPVAEEVKPAAKGPEILPEA